MLIYVYIYIFFFFRSTLRTRKIPLPKTPLIMNRTKNDDVQWLLKINRSASAIYIVLITLGHREFVKMQLVHALI